MKLRSTLRWLAGLAVCGIVALAMASGTASDHLKTLTAYRLQLTNDAREKAKADNSQVDVRAIQAQVKSKAEELIKGVDPTKVDATEAYEWAQLFNMAGHAPEAKSILVSYIATKPEADRLFSAQSFLVTTSYATKDMKTLAQTLHEIKGTNPTSQFQVASMTVSYAPTLVPTIGVDEAVKMIDNAVAAVDKKGLTETLQKSFTSIQVNAVSNKVSIYQDAGKKEAAMAVLDKAMTDMPENKSRFAILKNQMVLVGSISPALKTEKSYGQFAGLENLKGKVVIMDFFAHWCPPCKAAFPDMRQMYSDLQSKGLEMVGVTTYYGYINDPKVKLTPDEEYAKMADFIKEHNITWPILFGGRDNFEAYGVTGIPHVVVVGRDGIVHKLEIGYSKESFVAFRKEVEALLAQK